MASLTALGTKGQVVLITCLTTLPHFLSVGGLKMGPNKRTEDDKAIKHQKKGILFQAGKASFVSLDQAM